MKTNQKQKLISFIKKIVASLAIAIWIYIIYTISQQKGEFSEMVPYCMGSTMLIFGVLTGVFKALEYWQKSLHQ
jgi:peptidoglycan/LPS O-acetylase OafA/YrhL